MRGSSLLIAMLVAASPRDVRAGLTLEEFDSQWTTVQVSPKNGNLNVSVTEIEDGPIRLERSYNSRASFEGMFGFGWGTEYESYLAFPGDGTITVNEWGAGRDVVFTAVGGDKAAGTVDAAVDAISSAALAAKAIEPGNAARYRSDLRSDARFRRDEWERHRDRIPPPPVPLGAEFENVAGGRQTLKRVQEGYLRTAGDRTELFDPHGRLLRLKGTKGEITVVWAPAGKAGKLRIARLEHADAKVSFTYDPGGHVTRLVSNERVITFAYKGVELVSRKNGKKETHYDWSAEGRHNLVRIRHSDGSSDEMTFYPLRAGEQVRTWKDRLNATRVYTYADAGDVERTGIEVISAHGEIQSAMLDEYQFEVRADGVQWMRRHVHIEDDERSERTYDSRGLILKDVTNDDETTYTYDASGQLLKRQSPTEIVEKQWDPRHKKVTYASRRETRAGGVNEWSRYRYDDRGNVIHAETSLGQVVDLTYDAAGRVTTMRRAKSPTVSMKYNDRGKPTEIGLEGVGVLKVTYSVDGEILSVDNSGDRKVALQINSAYQELFEILGPAGAANQF